MKNCAKKIWKLWGEKLFDKNDPNNHLHGTKVTKNILESLREKQVTSEQQKQATISQPHPENRPDYIV